MLLTQRPSNLVDSSIRSHLDLLTTSTQFNNRVNYSLNCLANTINHSNSNRYLNIQFLTGHMGVLMKTASQARGCTHDQLQTILTLFNCLLAHENTQSRQDQALLLDVIGSANMERGSMGQALCQEIVNLCSKFRYHEQTTQFLIKIMAQKMSSSQAITLIDSFQRGQLHRSQAQQLINLAAHYNKDEFILCRILHALHWQTLNIIPQNPQKKTIGTRIIQFIKTTISNNIHNIKIISLCALVYRQLVDSKKIVDKNTISKNLDIFLRESSMKRNRRAYIPFTDQLINQFSELLVILQAKESIESNFVLHYILNYYGKTQFKWRTELLATIDNGKGQVAKELLLRSTESFEQTAKNTRKTNISSKQQVKFVGWLPLQCYRSIQGILAKIQTNPTCMNALQAIRNIYKISHQHPSFNDLLLLLHEIYIEHRQFQSLGQIQRIIKEQFSSELIIKKLKQKGSLKNVDSNRDSKRYFVCVPLVCSKNQIESQLVQEISEIFNHETVSINLKFYVANHLFSKMTLKPCKRFIVFLMRNLEKTLSPSVLKTLISYLKPYSENSNPAILDWVNRHFTEDLQRLMEFFFSKLILPNVPEIPKLLFLLQKFNAYGTNWTHQYRWSIASLEDVNETYPDYSLDCLQIFEMLIQKVNPSNIPEAVLQKFQKIITKNWGKYNQDHLFAIDRIVQILNQNSFLNSKQLPLLPFDQLCSAQETFDKQNWFYFDELHTHPVTRYIMDLIYNMFFGHTDHQNGINMILKIFQFFSQTVRSKFGAMTERNIIAVLNCLLWMFEDSEEQINPKIDKLVLEILQTTTHPSVFSLQNIRIKCIEFIAKVPHSINILKIEVQKYLNIGFYQKNWLILLTDLINIVIQSKPKAISVYHIHQALKSMIINLIAIEKTDLVNEYLDLIQSCCFIEGEYQNLLGEMLPAFQKALQAQRYQEVGYRKGLVQFLITTLLDYDNTLNKDIVWFLLRKYATESAIVELLLGYFQKQESDKSNMDDKLLLRLVLTHNQNSIIQQKCKNIFNTYVPSSSNQQQFMESLSNAKYDKCQEVIEQISNPYAINITLPDIKTLIQWKNTATSCKKLLRFLFDNPDTQNKIYQCQSFFTNSQYLPFICETYKLLKGEILLQKFNIIGQKGSIILKHPQFVKSLYKTITGILKNKINSNKLKLLLVQLFKKGEDGLGAFISLISQILQYMPHFQEKSKENAKIYYQFCLQIIGSFQLSDSQRVKRQILNQILYIFPYPIGQVHSNQHYNNLIKHYRSLHINFKLIETEININKYVVKLVNSLIKKHSQIENKDIFIQLLLKQCVLFENKCQFSIQKKQQQIKKQYSTAINELQGCINKYMENKLNDSSCKLEEFIVVGYISFLIQTSNLLVDIDIVSQNILKDLKTRLENFGYSDSVKQIIQSAIAWLYKKKNLSVPVKENIASPTKSKGSVQSQTKKLPVKQFKIDIPLSSIEESNYESTISHQSVKRPNKQNIFKSKTFEEPNDESNIRKQIEESYIKYKQVEEHKTITQNIVTSRTTVIILDNPNGDIFNEKIEQPKQQNFNQQSFYKKTNYTVSQIQPSEKQRSANIQSVKKLAQGEFSIQSLKDHCKYIASLVNIAVLSNKQIQQLSLSLKSVTETVNSHAFYVKKVSDNETILKVIKIYKNLFLSGNKKDSNSLILQILQFYQIMSEKKQKKLILFNEEDVIQFFKMIIKKSLNGHHVDEQIELLLLILYNCRNNTQSYYKFGLISMIIQLVNRDLSQIVVLQYLIKLQLSMFIINEIYQRGLFNKLIIFLSNNTNKKVLNLWIKLAGKVCINSSIQQRFRSKDLHIKVWQKSSVLNEVADRLNICYFFAYMCLKNEQIVQWLIQSKIMEELLLTLRNQYNNEQLYLLFYHFCFNNSNSRDYCFRIKYHLHLMEKLRVKWDEVKHGCEDLILTKYFYKSLGQMMTSKIHLQFFFKEEAVNQLIDIFNAKAQSFIFECLLDFISILETDGQFDELKRQNFWDALKIFQYKISSEATYSYLIQIFLIMIKKGRTRQFNQQQVRSKACLKAEYSINMEGKELVLRFIVALSIKNKQNYLTERCVRILSSIMGLKVGKTELQLVNQMLKIQGSAKNMDFLKLFCENNISNLIIQNLQKMTGDELQLALNILSSLCANASNIPKLCAKSLTIVVKFLYNSNINIFKVTLRLLVAFSSNLDSANIELFKIIEIASILRKNQFVSKIKENQSQKDYTQLVQNLIKGNVFSDLQISDFQKLFKANNIPLHIDLAAKDKTQHIENQNLVQAAIKALRQGKKVKMYKSDGSISELLLFISSDSLQINCGLKISEIVKQKWRLPLNEITKIIEYKSQQDFNFKNSYFQKNSGFFNKAPNCQTCLTLLGKNNEFHICFLTAEQQVQWIRYLNSVRESAKNLLSKLK